MLPFLGLRVDLVPREAEHVLQVALREPVPAHHVDRDAPARRGQDDALVAACR